MGFEQIVFDNSKSLSNNRIPGSVGPFGTFRGGNIVLRPIRLTLRDWWKAKTYKCGAPSYPPVSLQWPLTLNVLVLLIFSAKGRKCLLKNLSRYCHSYSETCLKGWNLYVFCYHEVGFKKLNACIRSSYAWFIFNLNTKQCYSQMTHGGTHMHRYTSTQQFFSHPPPCFPLLPQFCSLLYGLTPLFTYLENQLLLLVMRISIHTCPWFAINCSPLAASPTPRHPTDQVTYLHRWHQQRQPFRLTQYSCSFSRNPQEPSC